MENKKKKRYGIIAALLLLVLAAGVGTYAWLSATQSLKNEFTVGSIGKPEVKPDPDQPDKPGTDPTNPSVDGYLFETKWVKDSKMIPDTNIDNLYPVIACMPFAIGATVTRSDFFWF